MNPELGSMFSQERGSFLARKKPLTINVIIEKLTSIKSEQKTRCSKARASTTRLRRETMKPKRLSIVGKAASGSQIVGKISDGTSAVEQLMNEFEAHETHETVFLRRYKEMLETTHNPLVKFLIELIVTDEEKHHVVTHAMVSTLKGSLTWTQMQSAIEGVYSLGKEKDEILKVTEDFIRVEKEEIGEYRKLMRATKSYYQGVFTLFLAAMIHDSEKHVEILDFLRKKLKAA
jgi:bacterioferritin (cytochrome b1)